MRFVFPRKVKELTLCTLAAPERAVVFYNSISIFTTGDKIFRFEVNSGLSSAGVGTTCTGTWDPNSKLLDYVIQGELLAQELATLERKDKEGHKNDDSQMHYQRWCGSMVKKLNTVKNYTKYLAKHLGYCICRYLTYCRI